MMAASIIVSSNSLSTVKDNTLNLPKTTQFKIGLCQLSVSPDKNTNLSSTRNLIEFASKQGASLVVLPELASCQGITIVGGSMLEWNNGRLYNSCVFGPDGKLKAKHRKLHLFDIDIPGNFSLMESDMFTAGDTPTVVDTGVHLICYPGAFNMSTGRLLWELKQSARAVENQLYVATCSPSRSCAGSYMIWGHSTVVGPSGEVTASSGYEEAVVIAEIDYSGRVSP